jgi:FixJ family two-component response regulator
VFGLQGVGRLTYDALLNLDLPMIMATGYADLPAGPQIEIPRLAKPYSQATLAEAVQRVVSRSR